MSAPETLILIPGVLCDRRVFEPQLDGLAGLARCHVAEDHTRHSAIDRIAAAIIDRAPERFALAGLSMGGYVALEICRQAPERVSRLALLSTSARLDSEITTRARTASIEMARKGRFDDVLTAFAERALYRAEPGHVQTVIAMGRRLGPAVLARQQRAIMARRDQRDILGSLHMDTLVLCGQQDRMLPPDHAEEIAAELDNCCLHLLPDCGHLCSLEQATAVTELMEQWIRGSVH